MVLYCELCGNVIEGRGTERLIEGTKMLVCSNCSRFGKPMRTKPSVTPARRRKTRKVARSHKPKRMTKRPSVPSPEAFFQQYEVVADVGRIIQSAREKKDWTQEELGQELNEKASVIQKIESGRIKPTDPELILKLERTLDIEIHKPIENIEYTPPPTKGKGLTLGEVVKFKKKKKED